MARILSHTFGFLDASFFASDMKKGMRLLRHTRLAILLLHMVRTMLRWIWERQLSGHSIQR